MYQRAISHSLCPLRKKKEEDDLDHYYHNHLCKNPRSFVIFSEKMSEEEGKVLHHHHHHQQQYDQQEQPQPQYGTFQGVANYPPQPVIGFPQPVPPPGSAEAYAHGYQAVPVYTVAEGRPVRERRLPCCGLGFGWFLFIIGFFLAAIPWYVGAIILLCVRAVDYREKPGYIACMVAAVLATIAVIFGATSDDW